MTFRWRFPVVTALFFFALLTLWGCARTAATLAADVPPASRASQAHGVFLTFHLEVSDLPHIQSLWPKLVDFMDLADAYGAKVTLQFSPQWAQYVYDRDLTEVVRAWEENGHEIGVHHHGPSHKFFDGYTNRPDLIRTDGWYAFPVTYQGDMEAFMAFLSPLAQQPLLSAGMSDGDIDWPEGLRYYATKYAEESSKADLISTPWQATYNGYTVTVATNAGYAIDHLGDAAVTLADIEAALQEADGQDVLGLVVNDNTVSSHFDEIEPLFQLLEDYQAQARTIREVVGSFEPIDATPTPAPTSTPSSPTPTPQPFPLVPDATYGQAGSVSYVRIPATDCANLTATPIQVGDWLVYPNHEHNRNCSGPGPYNHALFGYNRQDGKLYLLRDDGAGEAPLRYVPEQDRLYWNVTFGGTVFALDPETFALIRKTSVQTTSDSSGLYLDGLYYFATVNTPNDQCQNPINSNCGAVFAMDAQGRIVHTLNLENGFRTWVGTGLTTDGQAIYIGSAKQTLGQAGVEESYLHGCSVTKVDKQLHVLATFDPGDFACYYLPYVGANADSVAGEVVPDGAGLWAPYVRPNEAPETEGAFQVALYRLNADLEEQCRVTFPFEPQTQAVGFYAAPTVDHEGNAYLAVTVPDDAATRKAQLWKVTPSCQTTLLAETPGSWAQASPTLADDQFVLFATDGHLQIITLDGVAVKDVALASEARVLTSPVIVDGVIYVVQEDGAMNVIHDAGVTGYGQAIWPRYRRDNLGSAALS